MSEEVKVEETEGTPSKYDRLLLQGLQRLSERLKKLEDWHDNKTAAPEIKPEGFPW